ncbi:CHP02436-containing protein [Gemmatirosa kalamazoonensis]|uniref:CHP02436-containing protein n=1 Tax=Gemmatirosa kalamazoonensis TaxID=861299 RepID=W0REV6_9BACT|nr:four helix bundle protein [Gemmatirosa kalamazoonensis]AHG89634.1 CHP02436-containing protein [Gemmatirosa kalamazoonensis]
MIDGDDSWRSFRGLRVWQEAIALSKEVRGFARQLPRCELSLAAQLRGSARSIHAHIAEGSGRATRADYLRFLYFSRGSLQELESDIEELADSDLATPAQIASLGTRICHTGRLLLALIARLEQPPDT